MRRTPLRMYALILLAMLLFGCSFGGDKTNTLKDHKKLSDVAEAVDEAFAEKYGEGAGAVAMGAQMQKEDVYSAFGLSAEDFTDYVGRWSLSMTNSDRLVGVRCKQGRADAGAQALEDYRKTLEAQYELYPVCGSYDRARAGQVYRKGDYVFLLVLGVAGAEGGYDFASDLQTAVDVIDRMFY